MKTQIHDRAVELMVEILGIDAEKITPSSSLVEDLDMDSIDTIDILMRLSDDFNLDLNPMNFEHCKTIQDFTDCLQEKLSEKK